MKRTFFYTNPTINQFKALYQKRTKNSKPTRKISKKDKNKTLRYVIKLSKN